MTPIVLNIINDVKSSAELESARTLINLINNYIATEYLRGNEIKENETFIIINDVVYNLNDLGKNHLIERIESRYGVHIIDAAYELGIGSKEYELIEIK